MNPYLIMALVLVGGIVVVWTARRVLTALLDRLFGWPDEEDL